MNNKKVSAFRITSMWFKSNTEKRIEIDRAFHVTFPNGIRLSTHVGSENNGEDDFGSRDVEIHIENAIGVPIREEMCTDLFPHGKDQFGFMESVEIEDWLKIFDWCRNRKV